ncbi:hypothetical protein HGA91_02525 [candidate division WWE3 bacterium]|nr:hypothetical protein [candidate division WWE3 bacterium]
MNYQFVYQGISGRFTQSPWTGTQRLFINGSEIFKGDHEWLTPQGWHVKSVRQLLLFPKLIIDGHDLVLVSMRWWEWGLVFLPMIWIFFGGIIPTMIGMAGIYLNASLFASHDLPTGTKLMFSSSLLVSEFVFLILVSYVLNGLSPTEGSQLTKQLIFIMDL